jgi:predicted Co/Zn/Cd cation transporter (cation efflux family)
VCTYTVLVNITLAIDEQLVERAREKLRATGKTINQEIREHLEHIVGDNLERDLEGFRQRVGQGNSNGWKWDRDELYEERTRWPRT